MTITISDVDPCGLLFILCSGHGKRSDDGSAPGGAISSDVMRMLRKTSDDEALGPFPPQARFDRVALLEKALIQLLRNRMMV